MLPVLVYFSVGLLDLAGPFNQLKLQNRNWDYDPLLECNLLIWALSCLLYKSKLIVFEPIQNFDLKIMIL